MTVWRSAWVAGMLGMWMAAGWAQEATEGDSAGSQAGQEVEAEEASPEADAPTDPDAADQAESMADAGVADAGTADGAAAFPEIAPLDELFVPSQNIRADEPVTFPVDF